MAYHINSSLVLWPETGHCPISLISIDCQTFGHPLSLKLKTTFHFLKMHCWPLPVTMMKWQHQGNKAALANSNTVFPLIASGT